MHIKLKNILFDQKWNYPGSVAQSVERQTCNQATLGSTPASSQKVADNILGQDMNLIIVSPHQGVIGTSR